MKVPPVPISPNLKKDDLTVGYPEWDFVQGLAYASQAPQDSQFVQLIYTSRLRKYKHTTEHALTRQKLVDDYGLGDNPDVLFSFADALYASFRWADCFTITSRSVRSSPPTLINRRSTALCCVVVHIQDPKSGIDPQPNHAPAPRVHVPSIAPPLPPVHPRARARRPRARERHELVRGGRVVPEQPQVGRG